MRAVRRYLRALIVLHRTFAVLPLGVRLHTLVRFLSCPFLRMMSRVPRGARLLEIGSGVGVFSRLAIDAGAVGAVAVEPDVPKALRGGLATRQLSPPSIHFVAGYDQVITGTFDTVAMIDVLYTIPKELWDDLLTRIASRVKPGGVFLLKEMDPRKRLKNGWNRLQETLAIRVFRFTMAETMVFEDRKAMIARLQRAGFGDVEVVAVDGWYPHPHLLYVAKLRRPP